MRITCPKCGFSREVDEDKIPPKAQIATCPKCSHRFRFRTLSEELKSNEDYSFETERHEEKEDRDNFEKDIYTIFSQETQEEYIAWEKIENFGFWNALVITTKKVMFHPTEFFKRLPLSGNLIKALIYYLIICEIQAISQLLWGLTGLLKINDPVKALLGFSISGFASILFLLLYPLFLTVLLFIGSGINHICLKIVGSGKNGFEATFKVVSYSIAPMWLSIVPLIGAFVGSIWTFVVSILGLASIHNSGIGRVILAIFLPVFLVFLIVVIKGIF